MKNNCPILSPRALVYGGICGIFCFISRTLFGSPLEALHILGGGRAFPPMWVFNFLSVCSCALMGMSAGWIIDCIARGYNSGTRSVNAYRGALYLSFAFFLFLIWFPVLFFAKRLFIAFMLSTLAMISSLACAIEWGRLVPTRATLVIYCNTIWLFYIMLVSLSVWWGS